MAGKRISMTESRGNLDGPTKSQESKQGVSDLILHPILSFCLCVQAGPPSGVTLDKGLLS